jgi:hypothetical protein
MVELLDRRHPYPAPRGKVDAELRSTTVINLLRFGCDGDRSN